MLVLAGSYDALLSPDVLRATVLSHIAGARMVTLPCGHEIPQEMPALENSTANAQRPLGATVN